MIGLETFFGLLTVLFGIFGTSFIYSITPFFVNRRGRGRGARRNQGRGPTTSRSTLSSGTQELAQVTVGTPSGTFVGAQIPLIPTVSPGSRLSNLALSYGQYVIEHSRVTFVTQTTTNSSGRLLMAWTFDALESTPNNGFIINQMAASRMTPVWRNITTAMPSRSPEKRRYAVIPAQDFSQLPTADKQIFLPATLVFGTDGSAQSGITVGSLIWHYRIRFFNPNVDLETTGTTTLGMVSTNPTVPAPRIGYTAPLDEEETPTPAASPAPSVAVGHHASRRTRDTYGGI